MIYIKSFIINTTVMYLMILCNNNILYNPMKSIKMWYNPQVISQYHDVKKYNFNHYNKNIKLFKILCILG